MKRVGKWEVGHRVGRKRGLTRGRPGRGDKEEEEKGDWRGADGGKGRIGKRGSCE